MCCVCRIAPCGLPKPSTWLCERFGRTGKPGRVNGGRQQCQSDVAWPYAIVQVRHLQVPPGKACSTCCALWQWVQASGATSHQCVGLAFCSQPTVGVAAMCWGCAHTQHCGVSPHKAAQSGTHTAQRLQVPHATYTTHHHPPPRQHALMYSMPSLFPHAGQAWTATDDAQDWEWPPAFCRSQGHPSAVRYRLHNGS